jgi:hypothetical protein
VEECVAHARVLSADSAPLPRCCSDIRPGDETALARSTTLDPIADRLERLERQFRRWKWIGIAVAVLIAPPIPLALVAFLMSDGSHEAQRLLVRDRNGRVRMDLGTDSDGTPRLLFFGGEGQVRLVAHLAEGDIPRLYLADEGGRTRLLLGTDKDGPSLDLLDADQRGRLSMTVDKGGSPVLQLRDRDGKTRLAALVESAGTTKLKVLDGAGKFRLVLGVNKEGLPAVGLMNGGEITWPTSNCMTQSILQAM